MDKRNATKDIQRLHDEYGPVFLLLLDRFGGNLERAVTYMENAHAGEYADLGEYAASHQGGLHVEELRALPPYISNHIDWDAVGRELLMQGGIFTIECEGAVHVFHAHL